VSPDPTTSDATTADAAAQAADAVAAKVEAADAAGAEAGGAEAGGAEAEVVETADRVLALTLTIGLLLVGAFTALSAWVYDAMVETDGVAGLDQPALNAAIAHRSALGNRLVTAFTHLGGPIWMPILATVAALILTVRLRRGTPVALIAATGLGSLLLTGVGKAVVARARPPLAGAVPPLEHSYSFPSGHALNSMALAGIVAYLLVRELRHAWARMLTVALAAAFAIAMGLSRVYLGHHWLTDVLVAWTIALAWLTTVITSHRLYLTLRPRPSTS
jgi:undecaprenyl-diphosphatase